MRPSAPCPRCGTRCVVTTAHQISCLACGHEQRDLPYWLTTTASTPLLPAQIDPGMTPFEDDEERRA
jgi:hypothetical protein